MVSELFRWWLDWLKWTIDSAGAQGKHQAEFLSKLCAYDKTVIHRQNISYFVEGKS